MCFALLGCPGFTSSSLLPCLREESAVLAKWLKGVTLAVAHANPQDEHCASLEYHYGLLMWFQKCVV